MVGHLWSTNQKPRSSERVARRTQLMKDKKVGCWRWGSGSLWFILVAKILHRSIPSGCETLSSLRWDWAFYSLRVNFVYSKHSIIALITFFTPLPTSNTMAHIENSICTAWCSKRMMFMARGPGPRNSATVPGCLEVRGSSLGQLHACPGKAMGEPWKLSNSSACLPGVGAAAVLSSN